MVKLIFENKNELDIGEGIEVENFEPCQCDKCKTKRVLPIIEKELIEISETEMDVGERREGTKTTYKCGCVLVNIWNYEYNQEDNFNLYPCDKHRIFIKDKLNIEFEN